ncbi:MAG: SRPBCC family protein [Desulfuromusa sp.]|jgi:ligand-binding SRPBCC domain-containing protein|nr:SRPBCC family protein [Desulfuromusa sp.]
MHFLEREVVLNVSQQTLWEFMATPANLNDLTPPELKFQIVSELPARMYNGLMIEYHIGIPLFGNWRWLTEIKHIREGEYFVDEQRLGPYRLWYHQHLLEPVGEEQTRMIDRVSYQLPFGILGRLVNQFRVKYMLDNIFSYRTKQLLEMFI